MNQTRCDYVHEDGSMLGRPCNELAEWEALKAVEDPDDAEHIVSCSVHLTDMLERDGEYLIHAV